MLDTPTIPPKTDPRWRALVAGENAKPVRLLALKFMLTRIHQEVAKDHSPATIDKNVDELHRFFAEHPQMVAADLATLFA